MTTTTKTKNETVNGDKEMSIGGSGFSVPSPGYNCKNGIMLIDFRSSLDNVDGDTAHLASVDSTTTPKY